MTDDTISRQAAIDEVEITPYDDYGDYVRTVELIKSLPSAQRKGGCKRCRQSKNLCSVCIRNENIKDHFYDDDPSHPFADDVMMERGEDE